MKQNACARGTVKTACRDTTSILVNGKTEGKPRLLNRRMSLATKILSLLKESPDAVTVSYTVTTPTGTKSPFTKTLSLSKVLSWFKNIFEAMRGGEARPQKEPRSPSRFNVDYFYGKNINSMGHTQGGGSLAQLPGGNAHSETAILAYLQRLHPGCTIQLNSVEFE